MIQSWPGVVVISDRELADAAFALGVAARTIRSRDGYESQRLADLQAVFRSALAAKGHTAMPQEVAEDAELVDTMQIADVLGCSARTARRRAQQYGRKVGGRWLTSAQAVRDLIDERNQP
jgi:hypothetical protein